MPSLSLDYSLTGENSKRAVEKGLAEADWYQSPISRADLRHLLERKDGPAIRDTLIWFALLLGTGFATWWLWPSWWAALPYLAYAALYSSTSDSRWHESGHGTAFKTDWLNNFLYEVSSFMVMRESDLWRWSHTRHHSDTAIVGRDPEIAVPRPPNLRKLFSRIWNLQGYPRFLKKVTSHARGRMLEDEKQYVPPSEWPTIYFKARIYVAIYLGVIGLAVWAHSILPLLFVGLPAIFGSWLIVIYSLTQHTGLAENVLDHRLNCRTIEMNFINRYLYWNMNYHLEHHMFPLVPYHALPKLHAAIKDDLPAPYPSLWAAWREIVASVYRQLRDPAYHVKRRLPAPAVVKPVDTLAAAPGAADAEGWIDVCAAGALQPGHVRRFDVGRRTFALVREEDGRLHATDGMCTHGNTHLADGLVQHGMIECPKHNGRFKLADGSPARAPVCRGLAVYPIEERAGRLFVNPSRPEGDGARPAKSHRLRVVSNRNVATFIKELVVEPADESTVVDYTPGDYLQFEIPTYANIRYRDFDVPAPYSDVWERQHVFDLIAQNPGGPRRNNYSIASNRQRERTLRFNIRIATPPPGQDCLPGVGSSYMFNLKPGDIVNAIGPYGDFHIKPTQKEMVYIGGGAGMAPLRAHLTHLLETENTARKISYWYGARSGQECFYEDVFRDLAAAHPNFSFHLALSSPLVVDNWRGLTGFIHEVVLAAYLKDHPNPKAVEYYLCGPPMMIKACTRMLEQLGVSPAQIAYDEF